MLGLWGVADPVAQLVAFVWMRPLCGGEGHHFTGCFDKWVCIVLCGNVSSVPYLC